MQTIIHLLDLPDYAHPLVRRAYRLTGLAFALVALLIVASTGAHADERDEFCAGFEEGYLSVRPNALVPLCPLQSLTALGSTPFREGIKAGIGEALRD
jgi:hypothetical protein